MAKHWKYRLNGLEHGPVSPTQLNELAASGTLQPSDMVWCEGLASWVSANTVAGLFTAAETPLVAGRSAPDQVASQLPPSDVTQGWQPFRNQKSAPTIDDLRKAIREYVLDPKSELPETPILKEILSFRRQLQEHIGTSYQRVERLKAAQAELRNLENEFARLQREVAAASAALSSLARPLGEAVFNGYLTGGLTTPLLADRISAHERIEQLKRDQIAFTPTAKDGMLAKAKAKAQQLVLAGKVKIEESRLSRIDADTGRQLIELRQESSIAHNDTNQVLCQLAAARQQLAHRQEQLAQLRGVLEDMRVRLAASLGIAKLENSRTFIGEISELRKSIGRKEQERDKSDAELPDKMLAASELPTAGSLFEMVNALRQALASNQESAYIRPAPTPRGSNAAPQPTASPDYYRGDLSPGRLFFGFAAVALLAGCCVWGLVAFIGHSTAYNEGRQAGLKFGSEMAKIAFQTGRIITDEEIASLTDVEEDEAETGYATVPYPKGTSERREWVKGFKAGFKEAVRYRK